MESLRDNACIAGFRRLGGWRAAGRLFANGNGMAAGGVAYCDAFIFEPLLFSSFPVHAHLTCVCAWIVVGPCLIWRISKKRFKTNTDTRPACGYWKRICAGTIRSVNMTRCSAKLSGFIIHGRKVPTRDWILDRAEPDRQSNEIKKW